MSTTGFGGLVTDVATSAGDYAPGFEVELPAQPAGGSRGNEGKQIWVYVFNDEAATAFAAGDIIVRDPSVTTQLMYGGLLAASGTAFAAVAVLGVAQHAIAAGSWGFILRVGQGLVKNGTANITADTAITSGGSRDGSAIDFAAGSEHAVIGYSLEAEATDNTTFDAFINCPG